MDVRSRHDACKASPRSRLPRGARLTDESWQARHRIISGLLWAHVPALILLGLLGTRPIWLTLLLAAVIAAPAAGGNLAHGRKVKASLTSVGLISCTFAAIELSGGQLVAHIHLYAVLIFIALYQQWAPLLWAVIFVVIHHATLGLIVPERVFGEHDMHWIGGLRQVLVHAEFALLEIIGILVFWHFAEDPERHGEELRAEAEKQQRTAARAAQDAAERRAEAERAQSTEANARAAKLSADAQEIGEEANTAITAVAAVDAELTALSTAVWDISARSAEAATGASDSRETALRAAEKVRVLEHSVSEIAEVNALIAQLAAQTNLLALNATIEAARAGECRRRPFRRPRTGRPRTASFPTPSPAASGASGTPPPGLRQDAERVVPRLAEAAGERERHRPHCWLRERLDLPAGQRPGMVGRTAGPSR